MKSAHAATSAPAPSADVTVRRTSKMPKLTLALLREQQGFTQEKLARRAKITQSEVSRTERDADRLVSTLERYAIALGGKLLLDVEINGRLYPSTDDTGRPETPMLTLALIREQRGFTQEKLARRAKITQTEVSRTERRNDCLVSTLERYATALGGKLLLHIKIDEQLYPVTL